MSKKSDKERIEEGILEDAEENQALAREGAAASTGPEEFDREESLAERYRKITLKAESAGLQVRLVTTGDHVKEGSIVEWYPGKRVASGDLEASMAFVEAFLESPIPYKRKRLQRRLDEAQGLVDELEQAMASAKRSLREVEGDMALMRYEMMAFADDYGEPEEEE